jgi:chemotaxis protein MotA
MIQGLIITGVCLIGLTLFGNIVGDTSVWMNVRSCLFVLGGTFLSAILAYSFKNIKGLLKALKDVFSSQETDYEAMVKLLAALAYVGRREGAKALEEAAQKTGNLFLRKGVELAVDGYDRYEIRNIMEQEYEIYFSRKESQVNILYTMTKLAPVFGFVGTIIGLINVLNHIGDPGQIGQGMAAALLTTFYGLVLANFLFMPLSRKLSEHIKSEATLLNLVLEGIVDIADEKNSRAVAYRLNSYLKMHGLGPQAGKARTSRGALAGQNQER